MPDSLQQELKEFEKQLSILLVRFMQLCDRLEGRPPEPPPLGVNATPLLALGVPTRDPSVAYA